MLILPASALADWPMVGHDAQRTSYSASEKPFASGKNKLLWYKEIPEYIPSRAQIITSESSNLIYVPSSKGVYALNPENGSTVWFYQTTMPVGNSPTISGTTLYIPVLDRTIHAVNAASGTKLWQTDEAGAGFYSNPLVANGRVYAGSRDGYMYAFNASNGALSWHYPDANTIPEGYISQSAALSTDGQTLFYTTSDSYAYALNANSGTLIWKKGRFPGQGFLTFWPVFYNPNPSSSTEDRIILSRAENYPPYPESKLGFYQALHATINGHPLLYSAASIPFASNGEIDGREFITWLKEDPDRQTIYVLNPQTGNETETAPILMWGNPTENHYPPAIGPDGKLWFNTPWKEGSFGEGRYGGWTPGSTSFKPIPGATSGTESSDEPEAISIFGGGIFHNDGGDGVDKGGITSLTGGSGEFWYNQDFKDTWSGYGLNWQNFKYGNGYKEGTAWNLRIGTHGIQNAPTPLKNKFFFHRSSNVIALCIDQDNNNQCDP